MPSTEPRRLSDFAPRFVRCTPCHDDKLRMLPKNYGYDYTVHKAAHLLPRFCPYHRCVLRYYVWDCHYCGKLCLADESKCAKCGKGFEIYGELAAKWVSANKMSPVPAPAAAAVDGSDGFAG